jgi:anti-sigma regulatory factor (Ser/Thr protein kinase)
MRDDTDAIPPLRFEMLSQPRYLSAIRAMISNVAHRFGFTDTECGQIALAVDEAICNIISHGYDKREDGRIAVSVWPEEEPAGLRLVIEDNARQVDPTTIKSRDLEDIRPGGLGVHIIREVMNEAVYEKRPEGGMRLTLIKRISSGQLAPRDNCSTGGGCT